MTDNQGTPQTPQAITANSTAGNTPGNAPQTPPKVVQSVQVGKYKVEVIREKCISAASCVAIAPLVFDLDEENIARVISQDGNDDDTKLLAAQSCPTAAIIVTDTTTGQQVWPR
jgi:ferredoxin